MDMKAFRILQSAFTFFGNRIRTYEVSRVALRVGVPEETRTPIDWVKTSHPNL